MFGYIFTLIVGLVCGASFFYMDLDARSDFLSLFLPFAFVVSGLACLVALIGWFFWKFGAPNSIDSTSGWFPWGTDSISSWYSSSSDSSTGSSDGSSSGSDAS